MTELSDPTCGDCGAFYKEAKDEYGTLRGLCMVRKELGEIPAGLEYCAHFRVKQSRAAFVKPVASLPSKKAPKQRKRIDSSQGTSPTMDIATLEAPVEGDVEGEITVDRDGLKQVLRELLEEENMYGYPRMGDKWEGGSLSIHPGDPEKQSKEISIDSFFHKIVMVRDRLRVLESKINSNAKLDEQEKVEMQNYISKCYGSLTTFNVMFKDKENQFRSK